MMYIFPNRDGGVCVFKNLKELKSAVDAIKRLPELDSIFDEPIPQPIPSAHPKHDVYHTLTRGRSGKSHLGSLQRVHSIDLYKT